MSLFNLEGILGTLCYWRVKLLDLYAIRLEWFHAADIYVKLGGFYFHSIH